MRAAQQALYDSWTSQKQSVYDQMEAGACYHKLSRFVRQAWDIIEPKRPLVWNWHLDVICDALEQATNGEINELVICIPPGMMKSLLVSVFWPAWQWLRDPSKQTLHISNHPRLSRRDARKTRYIVDSKWYKKILENLHIDYGTPLWHLKGDQNEIELYGTSLHGFRQAFSIKSAITGSRGDIIVIDDPYDAKQALLGSVEQVSARMEEVVEIYDDVISSRLNDENDGCIVTIMQRLHEKDLAGVLISRGVKTIILPNEFDPTMADEFDPRTVEGELLFPQRLSAAATAKKKANMSARSYSAQYKQRPTPDEGQIYKRDWFNKTYKFDAQRTNFDEEGISVDCAFKDHKDSDYVVIQTWGRLGVQYYLLDQVRAQMGIVATMRAIKRMRQKWPKVNFVLVEDKANGTAVIEMLQDSDNGVIPFDPGTASKPARAQLSTVLYEAGQVNFPENAPWLGEFVEEHCSFPDGSHDDQVDCATQILLRWVRPVDAVQKTANKWAAYLVD